MTKKKQVFEPFSEEQQKQYEREARLQYGPDRVNESIKRWNSYSKERQEAIQTEGGQIYLELVELMQAKISIHDTRVQKLLERWHENLRNYYEPTPEILRGLSELYKTDDFAPFFNSLHPDLPDYLHAAIAEYVDDLETAEIERMLAEDDIDSRTSRLSQ